MQQQGLVAQGRSLSVSLASCPLLADQPVLLVPSHAPLFKPCGRWSSAPEPAAPLAPDAATAAAAAAFMGVPAAGTTTKAPLVVPPGLAPTPAAAASVALAAMGLVAPFPGLPGLVAGATAGAAPLGLGMGVLDAAGRVVGLGGDAAAAGPGLGVSSSSKAASALEMPAELRLKDGLEQKKRRLEVSGQQLAHLACHMQWR